MPALGSVTYGGGAYAGSGITTGNPFNNTFPLVITEVAWANNPLDDPATWTDISAWVENIDIKRGRTHELNRFEAGTATLTLRNLDGRFSPFNTTSPYYPNVVPYRQIRIRALWNGQSYTQFRGHIQAWPVKWPSAADSTVTVAAVDAMKALNLKQALSLSSYSTTVIADSPVAYFRLSDTQTPPARDSIAGRYANLVLVNISPAPATLSTDFRGGTAGAIVADTDTAFTATNEGGNVDAYLSAASDFGIGNGAFSAEFWLTVNLQPGSLGALLITQNQVPFSSGLSATGWDVYLINGVIRMRVYTTGGGVLSTVTGAINVTSGTHHIVVTSDSTHHNLLLAVDGVADATLTGANVATLAPAYTEFGAFASGAPDGMFTLDEVAFYNFALNGNQIYNHYRAGVYPRLGETTGSRIGAYLDAVGWPATLRSLDAGLITTQGATNDAVNQPVLANIQIASDTELGEIFINAAGQVVFYDHAHKYKTPNDVAALVLGDSGTVGPGGESPYLLDSISVVFDDLDLYNEVVVTPVNFGDQVATDSTSQTTYGKRTLTKQGIHLSTNDALNEANWLVGRYKAPLQRIESISFTPLSDPTVLWPAAMGFELLTRITVRRRPKDGAGSTFTQDSLIEAIEHKIDASGMWTTTWQLSPTDATPLMGIFNQSTSLFNSAVFGF